MKYIVMCAGNGKRWNNYMNIPKHFVEVNGEKLIERTTRLLKENGINDYIITTSDERYSEFGKIKPQSYNDCEVDRFENTRDKEICYLYGDVYYTEDAMNKIIETQTDDVLFFGTEMEIVAVKVVDKKLFMKHKERVKKLFLNNKIDRCIGWEVYKSINNLPLEEYAITDKFYLITDETDDIDCPRDYEAFIEKYRIKEKIIKVEVLNDFTLGRYNEIRNLKSRATKKEGKLFKGDVFECSEELAKYLAGDNDKHFVAVKVLEVKFDE